MNHWEKRLGEILEIEDPRKAYLEIALLVHRENLSMTVAEDAVNRYMERHHVNEDEMAFYPNGDRVLTPEIFWEEAET